MSVNPVFLSLSDVRLVELQRDVRADGELIVAETEKQIPYNIARLFILRAPAGAERGKHAHKRCSQFLICVSGIVEIRCDDGENHGSFRMDRAEYGLLVPPGIWARLRFSTDAIVTVMCDRRYEQDDYIRNYEEFLSARRGTAA